MFGGMLGAARNLGGAALKSAQSAGMNFLNEAVKNGLVEDLLNQNFDGIANKAKKTVLQQVNKGMETLKNLSSKAQEFGNNLVKEVKGVGENLLKQGKGQMDALIRQGKTAGQGALDKVIGQAGVLKDKAGNVIRDGQTQALGLQEMFGKKTGQISNGIGSLLSRTFDGGNGMFTKVGQKLGSLAGGGPLSGLGGGMTGAGDTMLRKLTGNMQNLLPSGLGGSLQSGIDKMKSLGGGKLGGFMNNIGGGFGGGAGGIMNGLKDKVRGMIPEGGISLANGKKFTEKFLNLPDGMRLPTSMSGVTDKIPGLNKLPNLGGMADQIKFVFGKILIS